jgi:hypothetical protein
MHQERTIEVIMMGWEYLMSLGIRGHRVLGVASENYLNKIRDCDCCDDCGSREARPLLVLGKADENDNEVISIMCSTCYRKWWQRECEERIRNAKMFGEDW